MDNLVKLVCVDREEDIYHLLRRQRGNTDVPPGVMTQGVWGNASFSAQVSVLVDWEGNIIAANDWRPTTPRTWVAGGVF